MLPDESIASKVDQQKILYEFCEAGGLNRKLALIKRYWLNNSMRSAGEAFKALRKASRNLRVLL